MKELTREEVQARLREKGISQADIASHAGVSEQLVCQVIAGTRASQRVLNIISLVLGETITIERKKQRRKVKRILV